MPFIAGHFTATLKSPGGAAQDIGDTKEGYEEIIEALAEQIQTDGGGRTDRDAIQMGGNCIVRLDYVDYDLIEKVLFDQFAATPGATQTVFKPMLNVGKLVTGLAGELVLTPATGTSAAALMGAGKAKHYYYAVVSSDIRTLMAAGLRSGPCTFKCYPAPDSDATNKGKTWEIK